MDARGEGDLWVTGWADGVFLVLADGKGRSGPLRPGRAGQGRATAGRGMDTRVDVDDYGYYPWEGHDLAFGLPGSFLSPGYPALSYVPAPPLQTPGIRPIAGAGLCISPAADISSKEGGTCPWEGAGLL